MSLRPRPEVENLGVSPHGGIDLAEVAALGLNPESVLDFSVCTNPFMPPPGIDRTISRATIRQYPDSSATEFRQRLARDLNVPASNIIAGSGTTELIRLVALAYFRPGDRVLIPGPTFGEYGTASWLAGAELPEFRAREGDYFAPRIDELIGRIEVEKPCAVFICNPNNPTGKYLGKAEVEAVLHIIGDGLLVLDEAYVSFVDKVWPSASLINQGNVVVLRSMTKDYGIAGLRLGYAIANGDIIANLRRVCPPWNVNGVAQKIGTAVLDRADYLALTCAKVAQVKQYLVERLSRMGLPVLPSDAHYFLVKVGDARTFRAALLTRGCLVRDCASFDLPEYVRIAPRTMPECRKLIGAIKEILREEQNQGV